MIGTEGRSRHWHAGESVCVSQRNNFLLLRWGQLSLSGSFSGNEVMEIRSILLEVFVREDDVLGIRLEVEELGQRLPKSVCVELPNE